MGNRGNLPTLSLFIAGMGNRGNLPTVSLFCPVTDPINYPITGSFTAQISPFARGFAGNL